MDNREDLEEEIKSQGSHNTAIEVYDDSVARIMDEYLHRGDYLQLKEYLENSDFEKLIEKDEKFQKDVVKRMKDLI